MEPGLSGSCHTMRMMRSYAQPSGIFARCSPCATNQPERSCQNIPELASREVFPPFHSLRWSTGRKMTMGMYRRVRLCKSCQGLLAVAATAHTFSMVLQPPSPPVPVLVVHPNGGLRVASYVEKPSVILDLSTTFPPLVDTAPPPLHAWLQSSRFRPGPRSSVPTSTRGEMPVQTGAIAASLP